MHNYPYTGSPFWSRPDNTFAHGPERLTERRPKTEHIDWSAKYPKEVILRGPANRKQVALTFDDGPDSLWTPQVLEALSELDVKATFMCVGSRVQQNPQVAKQIVQAGHIIGNHTWDHPNLTKISTSAVREQIERTDAAILQAAGVQPVLMRPPYGAINDAVIEEMIRLAHKIIYWDVDSLDWAGLTGPQVVANILAHTTPGSIILQHSAGGVGESLADTVQAIPYVIRTLKEEGYQFVTIPELLGIAPYKTVTRD